MATDREKRLASLSKREQAFWRDVAPRFVCVCDVCGESAMNSDVVPVMPRDPDGRTLCEPCHRKGVV
jgi:formylmethanofuran dehydrogenase subunit E